MLDWSGFSHLNLLKLGIGQASSFAACFALIHARNSHRIRRVLVFVAFLLSSGLNDSGSGEHWLLQPFCSHSG
jgi:hypothetical protein